MTPFAKFHSRDNSPPEELEVVAGSTATALANEFFPELLNIFRN
jgi:hypothetical protein